MTTGLLKGLYTVAALLLAGAVAMHYVPAEFERVASDAAAYLLLHSYLPSAKTGKPQG